MTAAAVSDSAELIEGGLCAHNAGVFLPVVYMFALSVAACRDPRLQSACALDLEYGLAWKRKLSERYL